MMKRILITTALLLNVIISYAQWVQTNGPYGPADVYAIIRCNSKILAGTSCGLHENDSVSSRWNYFANIDIKVYDQKGDSIFYGSIYNGINLFILSSQNTKPVYKGLDGMSTNTIKCTDTCLFAGVKQGGFYKSAGFSGSWMSYNTGLPADSAYFSNSGGYYKYYIRYVYSIETLGDNIFCGTNKGVFKSGVTNISWSESNNGLPKEPVRLLEVFNDTIFACIDKSLYLSANNGDSWNKIYTTPSNINSVKKLNSIFYITTSGNGIYKSNNLTDWTTLNYGLSDLNIRTIELIDNILVCGSSTKGFHYLVNNSWVNNISGIICSSIRSMSNTRESIVANNDQAIFRLENDEWKNISPAVKNDKFLNLANMGDTIFVCNYYQQSDSPFFIQSIYYTKDFGISWHEISPLPYGGSGHTIYIDKNRLYAYTSDIAYFTDNLGMIWNDISLPSQYCNSIDHFITSNSIPFASTCGEAEIIALDNQNNWKLSNKGIPNDAAVGNLAKTKDALYAFIPNNRMYVSRDNGQSWTKAANGIETYRGFSSYAYKDKNIFLTTDIGVYYSDDYGQNWNLLNDGLINTNVSSIINLNDTLYVGTFGNGIWKRDIKSISLSINENKIYNTQLSFYPNPASDYLIVVLPYQTSAELQIFDMMGKLVKSALVVSNENINISNIPTGIYIVLLKTKNNIAINKVIIKR